MARVEGIGGFFFAARDPDGLARWYDEVLGIAPAPASYDVTPWQQAAGPTVFAPVGDDALGPHVGPRGWGLTLRVDDLDGMTRALASRGVEVAVDLERYPNGRFAQLADPEGNPVQLWEPA